MKKAGANILVILTVIFTAFLCGFFCGRNLSGGDVTLTQLNIPTTAPAQDHSEDTQPGTQESPTVQTGAAVLSASLVDINTASLDLLKTLPGIGDVLGQRIIDYREANGPFECLSELTNVEGIGEKKLAALQDFATVGG